MRIDHLYVRDLAASERILSSASPDLELYDQAQDEWVVLLRGEAQLELQGKALELKAGDSLLLRARVAHRVLQTSADALWSTVHVKEE
jgi:cupin 2 domain-containing protein